MTKAATASSATTTSAAKAVRGRKAKAPFAKRLNRKGEPLWRQLQLDLLDRIADGEFADSFPGEFELSQSYGVSRHTVREALRRMRESGVLEPGRGRSSRVSARGIEQNLGGLYSLFREVESQGHEQRSDVLDQTTVTDATAAEALGLPADTPLFHLERVRRVDGEPFAHDRVWIPAEVASPLLDADFTHAALYDELSRRCGVRPTGGDERISAVSPTPAQRELLELKRGVACFLVQRHGSVGGEPPMEYRVTLVRGDRYALLTSWTPAGMRPPKASDAPGGITRVP